MDRQQFFASLAWGEDRVVLNDLVFRLQHFKDDDSWELGDRCFLFFKTRMLIDQYEKHWASRPALHPRHIIELGMWDGGSVAFWFELFQPHKHIGVDIMPDQDHDYFREYVAAKGPDHRIVPCWETDQTDSDRLRAIVADDLDGSLDLVIDDASHLYQPTRSSFETLFPLLRPGGLYIIEDWAWAHWREFHDPDHVWAKEKELTALIFELVEATGSSISLIGGLTIYQGFTVIERGQIAADDLIDFNLEAHISRRPR